MSQTKTNSNITKTRECLYDILGVARNADNETIKQAYKKQARKWHPDKNINNQQRATIKFKEINEAYQILSDKHERSWYDSHRNAILRGLNKHEITELNNKNQNDLNYDPDIDIMPYFNPFIFTSYDDNDINNFYSIYNQLFIAIISIEKLSKKKTPIFGNSSTSYPKIRQFYEFWETFTSRRNFQWCTVYNLNDASNRFIRKKMHKENRKLCDNKRRKWENVIFKLVQFIKKRDKRYNNYLIQIEKEKFENELKMRQYKKEIQDIMKEEYNKQKLREIEENNKLLLDINDIDIDNDIEVFECVVCNKLFKSENAYKTHESSKKHIKQLTHLKYQLEMENNLIFNDKSPNKSDNDNDQKLNDLYKVDKLLAKQINQQQNIDNDNDKIDLDYLVALTMEQDDIIDAVNILDDNNDNIQSVSISDKEILALLNSGIDIQSLINTYPKLTQTYINELQNKNTNLNGNKTKKKKKKRKKKKKNKYDIHLDDNDDDNINEFMKNMKSFNKHKKNKKTSKNNNYINKHINDNNNDNNDNNSVISPKKKKKRRRAKNRNKNQRILSSQSNPNNITCKQPIKSSCNTCKQTFKSKTKLHDHLKEYPQHALKSQHL